MTTCKFRSLAQIKKDYPFIVERANELRIFGQYAGVHIRDNGEMVYSWGKDWTKEPNGFKVSGLNPNREPHTWCEKKKRKK